MWSQLLNKVFRRETRVIVEKSGIPVAAIISAQDLEQLNRLEAERRERSRIVEEIGARNADQGPEEAERFIAEEIETMRREEREKRATTRPA
jgi:prevent-host-death family protein